MSTPNQDQPRWAAIYEAATGATAPGTGHAEDVVGFDEKSVKAGHEPDAFDAKGIILVPIVIIVVLIVTYVIISFTFRYFKPGEAIVDGANPKAAADNAKDYNDRVSQISSTDEKAKVKQPRLEWLGTVDKKSDEPVFHRSFGFKDSGNPPQITPQYLLPENYVDWNTNEKKLVNVKWVSQEKGVVRIPIAMAMHILAHDKKLPAKPGAGPLGTAGKPKLSNGGQAAVVALPAAAGHGHDDGHGHDKDHKHDEPKKPEAKKDEPKKDDLKKETPKQ
ncbi:MAG: hypothetical protein ACRCZF_23115 [Gemmataceae bacterium]